jgi:hypothetical protein
MAALRYTVISYSSAMAAEMVGAPSACDQQKRELWLRTSEGFSMRKD